MSYKRIAILGIGTLGGYVTESLSTLETTEQLIVIDHDIVEIENLKDTIYRQIDIGLLKTDAIYDIIKSRHPEVDVIKVDEKFIESETDMPECDLVLDCRNYTYDRMGKIDARLYISSRYLIVDCRKNVSYTTKRKGEYLTTLTKDDLRSASYIISMLVSSFTINALIKDQAIQKYELDCFKKRDDSCYDIVYEKLLGGDKFINLADKIIPMIEMNKKSDISVIVGNRESPSLQTLIPKQTLKSSGDVALNLASLTNLQNEFNNYIIAIYQDRRKMTVELIPETGAA